MVPTSNQIGLCIAAIAGLGMATLAGTHRDLLTSPVQAPMPASMPVPGSPPGDLATRAVSILQAQCWDCHGEAKASGKLRLNSRDAAIKGGSEGAAIVPGDSESGHLLARVMTDNEDDRMPLGGPRLADDEVAALRAWIAAGAPWPEGELAPTGPRHWAFRAPVRPPVPTTTPPAKAGDAAGASVPADWPRTPIDQFILTRLQSDPGGVIDPSPPASKAVLLRRVSLDLIGLPPTLEEIDAFERDTGPDAYERVVDRLLASPRFGEKWARPWLDLARYADSQGYEKDGSWSMWAYRDWVIDALNADMPFDQFTIEQIAGDMLQGATMAQQIATGFNRCTMINEEGGTDPEEQRVNAVFDRVDTTAMVWLGSTLACARCHDHKYDPVTQKDYFAFFAFFNNSPAETEQTPRAEIQITSHKLVLPDPEKPGLLAESERLEGLLTTAAPGPGREGRVLAQQLARVKSRLANPPTTQVMKELPTPRQTRIMERGNFLTPGEPVEPDVPAILPRMTATHTQGRRPDRLALARWLVAAENPLTARVQMNRIWEQYFGRGLVETSEDFGTRGSAPSHPELLDWLAIEFVAKGWSQKAMHKLIVISSVYRQSAAVSSEALDRDPGNRLLARGARFRLDAETIRDQALMASGLLSTKMGGPSVYPPQPAGIWSNPYVTEPYRTSTGEDRYRRGIYTFWKRSAPYPTFVAFDAPQRQVSCTRRPRTNTPLQALALLNDPAFVEPAIALARRAAALQGDDAAKLSLIFRSVITRQPSDAEQSRLAAFHANQLARYRADHAAAAKFLELGPRTRTPDADPADVAAWAMTASVILNLDEAVTKP